MPSSARIGHLALIALQLYVVCAFASHSCVSPGAGASWVSASQRGSMAIASNGSLSLSPDVTAASAYGALAHDPGPFVAISSAIASTVLLTAKEACALRTNGSLTCVCTETKTSRCASFSVPAPNSGFDAIAAAPGGGTWLARRANDASLAAWGKLFPTDEPCYACSVPSPNSGWGDFSVGYAHACAIHAQNGSVTCWGSAICDYDLTLPPHNSGFVQVAIGTCFKCLLRANGTIWCSGGGGIIDAIPGKDDWLYIAAGYSHVCGIKTGGSVACWGMGDYAYSLPTVNSGFVTISLGEDMACGARKDGSTECWGIEKGWLAKGALPLAAACDENGAVL